MSGPQGIADYIPRTLRVTGPQSYPVAAIGAVRGRPVPPGGTWRVNAIIVVMDALSPAGLAIISTSEPGDWTSALTAVPVANGIAYFEPRRLILGDSQVLTAQLSGLTLATFARLDMMVEQVSYLPDRTSYADTALVVEPGHPNPHAEWDALHGYDPSVPTGANE